MIAWPHLLAGVLSVLTTMRASAAPVTYELDLSANEDITSPDEVDTTAVAMVTSVVDGTSVRAEGAGNPLTAPAVFLA